MEVCAMRSLLLASLVVVGLGCTEQRATVRALASLAPPLDMTMLTVTFREGGRSWQARGLEFTSDASLAVPHTSAWNTGTAGSMDIAFELLDSAGTVAASGQVSLELRADWAWGVQFSNVTEDPGLGCLGCSGSRAFPLAAGYRASGRDSLWVLWGGNSISHPSLY
jgi:hypothetical protein